MSHRKFKPGDCVRLSAKFLQSTGQYVGGEGHNKWLVVKHKCGLCEGGRFVAVDEPALDQDYIGPGEDLINGQRPRHINTANLLKCKSPDYTGL